MTRRPTPSRLSSRMPPASYALLSTWQDALAFNQPLSLDTSQVISMLAMFKVRSAPVLRPISRLALPCTLLAPPPLHCPFASRPRTSPRFVSPTFDSAEHGVQPAAQFRHVQRHIHELHVSGALCRLPCAQSPAGHSPACILRRRRSTALPSPGPHLAPLRMLPFRLGRVPRRSTSR